MRGVETVTLPLLLTLSLSGAVGCTSQDTTISNASLGLTLEMFPLCSVADDGAADLPANAGGVSGTLCRRGGVSRLPRGVSVA